MNIYLERRDWTPKGNPLNPNYHAFINLDAERLAFADARTPQDALKKILDDVHRTMGWSDVLSQYHVVSKRVPVHIEDQGHVWICRYANGSIERRVGGELGAVFFVTAPNPFGKTWDITFDIGIHNGAWRAEHIKRRGDTWRPVPTNSGWVWEKETEGHKLC